MVDKFVVYAAPANRPAFSVECKTKEHARALVLDFAKLYKPENVSVTQISSVDITDALLADT